ncbi:MAG: ATP-binding protein [Aeromicrobium sp.]|uniref:ATP-binding protein n=1 Tax=Aeromicrobium sp. TaxID=1871063 RepID=UPI00261B3255|nr:ATP-binding protein [Aeromicrobium sp.]MDF1705467.1 ATP-binding protein [Aeromicrobium sp.]
MSDLQEPGRGALRVYLGAAPGVGKTYRMLDEACRRAGRGTDVVVGVVETHGRTHTAERIGGLEVLPRRTVTYRGTEQTELDLPGLLARNPQVAVVDELAHTNVPGLEHAKRWQDVEALLAAGIDVITTVNVQHLESLNDVVEAITGVQQRETVPDRFVRSADAIELVDMSPQALRRRMAHGNVYPADRVDAALGQYFREGNLTALREVALLWLADRVEEGLARYRAQHDIDATWAARERLVVAVTGGPESEALMRRAARIASRTGGGQWMALYVARGDGLVHHPTVRLEELRAMAADLGGSFHSVVGDDAAGAILSFARAENATQVVIGASRRGRVSTLVRPGIGEVVIAESGDIDVHIVTHDQARRQRGDVRARPALAVRRRIAGFVLAVLGPLALAAGMLVTPDLHSLPSESMLFMVVVVATALVGGLAPAVVAALVSGFALNYFFTPPLRTLIIGSAENAYAVALFIVVAVAVSSVVDLAARRTAQALRATAEADALSALAHGLLHAGLDVGDVVGRAREVFGLRRVAVVDRDGAELVVSDEGAGDTGDVRTTIEVDETTSLVFTGHAPSPDQLRLMTAYAAHVRVLAERRAAARESAEREALAEADRARAALLAAVSHDLRTPLASVKAAASSLRNGAIDWSPDDTEAFLATIEEGADRLDALVANLLDMSRLEAGAVSTRSGPVELDALVRVVVATLEPRDAQRVEIDLDSGLLAWADGGLLERVVDNLVSNAVRHAPAPAAVRVDATLVGARVVLRVTDTGPGIAAADRERVFAPFQRLGDVPGGSGIGLGLAVARGLTEAMAGTLALDDTPGGGTTFVVDLPARGEEGGLR